MNKYNYSEMVFESALEAFGESDHLRTFLNNLFSEGLSEGYYKDWLERLSEEIAETLRSQDSVTGNLSESFYCNSYKATNALEGNEDCLLEALLQFDLLETFDFEEIHREMREECYDEWLEHSEDADEFEIPTFSQCEMVIFKNGSEWADVILRILVLEQQKKAIAEAVIGKSIAFA